MKTAKELHLSLRFLETMLAQKALRFAEQSVSAKRRHMGAVCLTAQTVCETEDRRFEFRGYHDEPVTFAELRLRQTMEGLVVEFRESRRRGFDQRLEWAYFDTLSKVLILEGLERANGACSKSHAPKCYSESVAS